MLNKTRANIGRVPLVAATRARYRRYYSEYSTVIQVSGFSTFLVLAKVRNTLGRSVHLGTTLKRTDNLIISQLLVLK
jgi:hypothetical protein